MVPMVQVLNNVSFSVTDNCRIYCSGDVSCLNLESWTCWLNNAQTTLHCRYMCKLVKLNCCKITFSQFERFFCNSSLPSDHIDWDPWFQYCSKAEEIINPRYVYQIRLIEIHDFSAVQKLKKWKTILISSNVILKPHCTNFIHFARILIFAWTQLSFF